MKRRSYILIIFLVLIVFLALFSHNTDYFKDFLFSSALMVVFFLIYEKLRLTPLTYSLVGFSLLVHNLGVFGFYANSPFNIPYDTITHFIGLFTAALVIANVLSVNLSKDKKFKLNDFVILFLVFLGALGVGSIIENMEYGGYLIWGEGEGFFEFGKGDYQELSDPDKLTLIVGGGYFDAMQDLIANLAGALLGVVLFGVLFFGFKKGKV